MIELNKIDIENRPITTKKEVLNWWDKNMRNWYIDCLLSLGVGGMQLNGCWVPVYDLADAQLVQLFDLEMEKL